MNFRVVVQRLGREDLRESHAWAAQHAPLTADLWLERFRESLRTLDHDPQRCPLARENGKVDVEVREFLFGKKPWVFRVIFTIDGNTVRVLRIRRAQRRPLTRRQIDEALRREEDA